MEPVKRPDQFLGTPRIVFTQGLWLKTVMGHIAAATPRKPNFGKKTRPFFQESYTYRWIGFGAGNRRKKPGRPSARDYQAFRTHEKTFGRSGEMFRTSSQAPQKPLPGCSRPSAPWPRDSELRASKPPHRQRFEPISAVRPPRHW